MRKLVVIYFYTQEQRKTQQKTKTQIEKLKMKNLFSKTKYLRNFGYKALDFYYKILHKISSNI